MFPLKFKHFCPGTVFLLLSMAGNMWPAIVLGNETTLPFDTLITEYRSIDRQQVFDGVVEAVNKSTISSQVAARVEAIMVDVDDIVDKGTVIIRFRNPEQQAALKSAKASMREAEALAEDARREYARVQKLHESQMVSAAELDRTEAAVKAARARFEAAQAAVAQATEQLEHTLVRAPYSGIVTERHIEVGEMATVGKPLMSGLSLDALRINVYVPQSIIDAVRRLQRAAILIEGHAIPAGDITVFPYADEQSHSFRVRVQLDDSVSGLYPGMLAKVAFAVDETEALLIPVSALMRRSEITGVYVIDDDNRISLRHVRTGEQRDGDIEILAGLDPGETIALDPIRAAVYLKERGADTAGTD